MQAFHGFEVVPGNRHLHQVNLIWRGVFVDSGVYYPDSLVGTDSHDHDQRPGIVGWGVRHRGRAGM
jgi:aconitate hydratase